MLLQRRSILSKRKTGALRKQQVDTRFTQMDEFDSPTFYSKESKTINFNQGKVKLDKRPIHLSGELRIKKHTLRLY